jgi:hypothetical protein
MISYCNIDFFDFKSELDSYSFLIDTLYFNFGDGNKKSLPPD